MNITLEEMNGEKKPLKGTKTGNTSKLNWKKQGKKKSSNHL